MRILKRLAPLLLATIFFIQGGVVSALPQADLDSIYKNSVWYVGGSTACTTTGGALIGTSNLQKAFNYFIGEGGLSPVASAAIVGNFWWESQGVDPTLQQDGTSDPFPKNGVGFGIAQWTFDARQKPLVEFAQAAGKPVTDLGVQLDFAWHELTTGYTSVLSRLRTYTQTSQLNAATEDFMLNYEAPSLDPNVARLDKRIEGANLALKSGATVTSGSTVGCSGNVNCAPTGPTATVGLSQVRQNIVCIAEAELKTWQDGQGDCHKYAPQPAGQECEEWCANFISWIFREAGYPFTGGESGGWRIPFVPNIQALGQQNQNFHWHPVGSYTPKPGDIAIYGARHTNLVISVSGGTVTTIGGNQSGKVSQGGLQGDLTGYVTPD